MPPQPVPLPRFRFATSVATALLIAFLLLLHSGGRGGPALAQSPDTTTVVYPSTSDFFANPERGFYKHEETHSNAYVPLNQTALEGYRQNQNITLILRIFYLDDFVNGPISAGYLDAIAADFNTLRAAGLKAVVRFAYTNQLHFDANTSWPPVPPYGDATKAQMLAHLDQLAPVLQANSDVIALLQTGFIGIWGEWYYTDYFVDDPSNPGAVSDAKHAERGEILSALLAAAPEEMAQLRTPLFKQKIFGTGSGAANALPEANAFDGSNRARTGHHNDCFLAGSTDFGTYDWANPTDDRDFLAAETKYLPMGGETCNDTTDDDDPGTPADESSDRSLCPTALAELEQFHWSYLNTDYNRAVLDKWETGYTYKGNFYAACMDEVKRRLGYRFALIEGTYPNSAQPGGTLNLDIDLRNEGWAAPFNPRPVELVLRHTATQAVHRFPLNVKPRLWLADDGGLHNISQSVALPGNLPVGDYDLFLALPDPDAALANRPEYAIRLANAGVWDADNGWNNLLHRVTVQAAAPVCTLYLVAIHNSTVANAQAGELLVDILNGSGAGNFGWLRWASDSSTQALVAGLTPPGSSSAYVNPNDPADHVLSVGDWVRGRPGVSNAKEVRNALDHLIAANALLTLPVWDVSQGQGNNSQYRVSGFAQVRLRSYRLPGQNRISAEYVGPALCGEQARSSLRQEVGGEVDNGARPLFLPAVQR